LRCLRLGRGSGRRLSGRWRRRAIGDLGTGAGAVALEINRAEHAQNQGEQRHQQQRCAPSSSGSRGGSSRLVQYSTIQTRRPLETLTWRKAKSRPVSHLAERFPVDDAERSRPGNARACESPLPPMVFWRLRNEDRWGRVTGPYVSLTRRRDFRNWVKPKPRSARRARIAEHRRARTGRNNDPAGRGM
jgi:hypothetical protein